MSSIGDDVHEFGVGHLRDRYTHPSFALIPVLPFVRISVLQGKDCSSDADALRCGEEFVFEGSNTSRAAHAYGVAEVRIPIDPGVNRILRHLQMPSKCRDAVTLPHIVYCALAIFRTVLARSAEHIPLRLRLALERIAQAIFATFRWPADPPLHPSLE